MKWQSNASYPKPVEEGTIFTNNDKGIRVHRIVGCTGWYLSCAELNFSAISLDGNSFDDAVSESKRLISDRLEALNKKYESFINDGSDNEIVRYW